MVHVQHHRVSEEKTLNKGRGQDDSGADSVPCSQQETNTKAAHQLGIKNTSEEKTTSFQKETPSGVTREKPARAEASAAPEKPSVPSEASWLQVHSHKTIRPE